MNQEHVFPAIVGGVVSAIMIITLNALEMSVVLFALSAVPLIYVGVRYQLQTMLISIGVGSVMMLGVSPMLLIIYLGIIAVPSLFAIACMIRGFSPSFLFSEIAIFAIVSVSLIEWQLQDSGGLKGVLSDVVDAEKLASIDPAVVEKLSWMLTDGSFLMIAAAVWIMSIFFYGSLWIAANLLIKSGYNIAPTISPDGSNPPIWALGLLLIFTCFSMLGGEPLAYISKLNFLIILLPYCFSGAMYTPLRKWQGMQTGWAFLIYFLAMMITWPAVFFSALGVVKHTQAVLKK